MAQFAIPLDNGDDGLVAAIQPEFERMALRIIGQSVRHMDGMPMIVVEIATRDDIAADIKTRQILAHYDIKRIAA